MYEYTLGISFSCLAKALGLVDIILVGREQENPVLLPFEEQGFIGGQGRKVLEKTFQNSLKAGDKTSQF